MLNSVIHFCICFSLCYFHLYNRYLPFQGNFIEQKKFIYFIYYSNEFNKFSPETNLFDAKMNFTCCIEGPFTISITLIMQKTKTNHYKSIVIWRL